MNLALCLCLRLRRPPSALLSSGLPAIALSLRRSSCILMPLHCILVHVPAPTLHRISKSESPPISSFLAAPSLAVFALHLPGFLLFCTDPLSLSHCSRVITGWLAFTRLWSYVLGRLQMPYRLLCQIHDWGVSRTRSHEHSSSCSYEVRKTRPVTSEVWPRTKRRNDIGELGSSALYSRTRTNRPLVVQRTAQVVKCPSVLLSSRHVVRQLRCTL